MAIYYGNNGQITIYRIAGNEVLSRTYIGYTERAALEKFNAEFGESEE